MDHVVHNHASSHDLPYSLNTPLFSKLPINGQMLASHPFGSLLFFYKPLVFLLLRITTCLHKYTHVIWMVHNLIIYWWCLPTGDHWSTLISLWDLVMLKKECQIHRSWLATASSITIHPSTYPEYCPWNAKDSSSTHNGYNLCFQARRKTTGPSSCWWTVVIEYPLCLALSSTQCQTPQSHLVELVHWVNACRRIYSSTRSSTTP
jgi:hypothetical protein